MGKDYIEKLKDPRWQKKRLEILQEADFECSHCGDKEKTLHVHHSYYKAGLQPWEYPLSSLYCLCEICHKKDGELTQIIKDEFNKLQPLSSEKFELLGFLQALNEDGPKSFDVLNYHHADGIGKFWGLTPEEVINLADDKGYISESSLRETRRIKNNWRVPR